MCEDIYSNVTQVRAQSGLCADVSGWQAKVDMGQHIPVWGELTRGNNQRHRSHQDSPELVMGRTLFPYRSSQEKLSMSQKPEHHAVGELQSQAVQQGENQCTVCRGEHCVQVLKVQAVCLETSRD